MVSACLMGEKVRYDGGDNRVEHDLLLDPANSGRVFSVCPETAGGLPVPRAPAEISGPGGGEGVLDHKARVLTVEGADVTAFFLAGAAAALSTALENRIEVAVLKENSPSCGVNTIYDGTFTRTRISGYGTVAALLKRNGVAVFGESELDAAIAMLNAKC